jgi:iron-sulfur cluster insertion protein
MIITNEAYARIGKLLAEEEGDLSLRVYVQGGGCSGFQYGFAIEETVGEDDSVYEQDGIRVLIDPMSLMYLEEATLDYKTSLEGDMFAITNPQAKTTCGCGSSFGA